MVNVDLCIRQDDSGCIYIDARGKSFDAKEFLKTLGFLWDAEAKAWIYSFHSQYEGRLEDVQMRLFPNSKGRDEW